MNDLRFLHSRLENVGDLNNFNVRIVEQANKTAAELKINTKKFNQIKEAQFPDTNKIKPEYMKPLKNVLQPIINLQPAMEAPPFSMDESNFDVAAFCASTIIECTSLGITFEKLCDPRLLNGSQLQMHRIVSQKVTKMEEVTSIVADVKPPSINVGATTS